VKRKEPCVRPWPSMFHAGDVNRHRSGSKIRGLSKLQIGGITYYSHIS